MNKISIDPNNIDFDLVKKAAGILNRGGVVALPTETVYGLAGCSDEPKAVERLYALKKRPQDKPFSIAIDSIAQAINNYFDTLPPFGFRLVEKFWPGPLTIIYFTPEDNKIGIRVPSHMVTSEILRELNRPIYFPSANISGEKEALSAQEVQEAFNNGLDLIVDGGQPQYLKSSTVLDLTVKPFKVLREGVVSQTEVIKVFIKKRVLFVCTGNSCRSPMAQFLLRKYLTEKKPYLKDRYEIISAGTSAFSGEPVSDISAKVLEEREQIDTEGFASQRLDKFTVLSSDLIFAMEDSQVNYILKFEPKAEGKVFNLKKFLPSEAEKDIPDPIGSGPEKYEKVYNIIRKAIIELVSWL